MTDKDKRRIRMLSGLLNVKLVVGVGKFAEGRAKSVIKVSNIIKYSN